MGFFLFHFFYYHIFFVFKPHQGIVFSCFARKAYWTQDDLPKVELTQLIWLITWNICSSWWMMLVT